tara:strand:+ start:29899 stop:30255 length:357 start_codon:yes stop_codon:yes gene_type:complete
MPGEQCTPEAGPVPEGQYKVFISDHGIAEDDGRGICALKPSWGIQVIPRGSAAGGCEPYWANWGKTEQGWNLQMMRQKHPVRPTRGAGSICMILPRDTVTVVLKLKQKYLITFVNTIQ